MLVSFIRSPFHAVLRTGLMLAETSRRPPGASNFIPCERFTELRGEPGGGGNVSDQREAGQAGCRNGCDGTAAPDLRRDGMGHDEESESGCQEQGDEGDGYDHKSGS